MAYDSGQLLPADDLNKILNLLDKQAVSAQHIFVNAGNPRVSSPDFYEQSLKPNTVFPASSTAARLYVERGDPPRLMVLQDDGDRYAVGGAQYDETNRQWILYDRELETRREGDNVNLLQNSNHIEIVDDFFKTNVDTVQQLLHTVQGQWKYLAVGALAATPFPAKVGRGGIVNFQTSGTSGQGMALLTANATTDGGSLRRNDAVQFMVVLALVDTVTLEVTAGLGSDPTAAVGNPGDDGIFCQFDTAGAVSTANWVGTVRTGGTSTSIVSSSIGASTDAIHLLFIVRPGIDVKFYTRYSSLNEWTLVGTNTASQPAVGINMFPFVRVVTRSAAKKEVSIYRMKITANKEI